MTGSIEGARLALSDALPLYSDEGTARYIYLHNGVIYKVETGMFRGIANKAEYANYLKALDSDLPDNVKVPETSLYTVAGQDVIAMTFIDGIGMYACNDSITGDTHDVCCLPEWIPQTVKVIEDFGGLNVIKDNDGIYWIIDLEC